MPIDYTRILDELLQQHAELVEKRDALEIEIGRVSQLAQFTFLLLPPGERARVAGAIGRLESQSLGLKAAVRIILNTEKQRWFTPPDVRDRIKEIGLPLDLGTNPLASINTTLRRLVPDELETKTLDNGQTAYRVKDSSHPIHKLRMRQVNPGASGRLETWMALNESPKEKLR